MKLVVYYGPEAFMMGIHTERGIIPTDMQADYFFTMGLDALEEVARFDTPAADVLPADTELAPCIYRPGKILCVGLNYAAHARESGAEPPPTPILFGKFENALAAHGEDVPFTDEYTQLDYEAELVVVMGHRARNVPESEALDYVLGYCNGNDLSERALQLGTPGGQWLLGKTPDKFMPVGPYLVTADEVPDPQNLTIKGWLNGELRQHSTTADMIFSVAQVIAYASRFMTLDAGDMISTGTPEGVILGMADKVWMQPGDEYSVEIGNLGRLTNKLVKA